MVLFDNKAALTSVLMSVANLWISTGDTNSKIHKDSNNQMNCLYKGYKEWSLFHPLDSRGLVQLA